MNHVSVEKFKKAKAAIARLPSHEDLHGMTFRGVPMTEFTKEQILRVLAWQLEQQEKQWADEYKGLKVFRNWP